MVREALIPIASGNLCFFRVHVRQALCPCPISVAPDLIAILRMSPETAVYICLSSWVLGLAFLSKLRTSSLPFPLWNTHLVLTSCLFALVLVLLPAPFLTDFPAPPPPHAEFYVCPPRLCARESPDLVCHPLPMPIPAQISLTPHDTCWVWKFSSIIPTVRSIVANVKAIY